MFISMADRTKQPEIVIPHCIDVLQFSETKVPNGVNIYSVNTGTQDVLRISVVFRAGVKYQNKPFVASSLLNMLSEGTRKYSSEQISERLDFYGLYYDVSLDRDYSVVTICCLKRFFKEALDILEEALLFPSFPEEELNIYKAKRKQALLVEREKVDFRARELFAQALYGKGHPYGFYSEADCYDLLNTEDIKSFYKSFYCKENVFCVVSGKIEEGELDIISELMQKLPSYKKAEYKLPMIHTDSLVEIKKEGALQSAIRIGKVLFPRNHPDFIGMQVVAMVLGGYFGSRLVSNLREDKGYTYGAFAGMINMEDSGYLAISTEVAAEYTRNAVDEIYKEIKRLSEELVPEEELNMVKSVMMGEIMRILDGPFGIADVSIENVENGKDNRYVEKMVDEINNMVPERIQELSRKYLDKEDFVTVIVGAV